MVGHPYEYEVCRSDLSVLSGVHGDRSPAWLMQALCALLYRGKHPCFLSEQVARLSPESTSHAVDGLIEAIDLIRELPPFLVEHMSANLSAVRSSLLECDRRDHLRCKRLAHIVMDDIWRIGVYDRAVVFPKQLYELLKEGVLSAVTRHSSRGVCGDHILLLSTDDDDMTYESFGSSPIQLHSHITNLLANPFQHSGVEMTWKVDRRHPYVLGFIKAHPTEARLLLVVADRGPQPARRHLWARASGLANIRACLQVIGGDLVYHESEDGLASGEYAPSVRQVNEALRVVHDLKEFRNMFVTSWPIIREGL